MSGPDDVTVVWVEKAEGRDDAVRAMNDWARARGVRLRDADGAGDLSGATPSLGVDLTIADRVERELDRAREAIAALEADGAERALARAETLVREHPELPQAAWLRAEVSRSWAARFARVEPRDEARATAAGQEADALDGGRATGIGEVAFPARPKLSVVVNVRGGSGRVAARLDGLDLACTREGALLTCPVEVAPAEHHLVLAVEGEPVSASWVSIVPLPAGVARPPVAFVLGDEGVCSASSFGSVRREGSAVRADGVSCGAWVAVAPGDGHAAVLVARCEGSHCGPFVEWRSGGFGETSGGGSAGPATPHRGAWPAWAAWTAVGVGAAVATTVALIATGVFESRPTEPRFTAGGVRIE